jgi:hypothetical protein
LELVFPTYTIIFNILLIEEKKKNAHLISCNTHPVINGAQYISIHTIQ